MKEDRASKKTALSCRATQVFVDCCKCELTGTQVQVAAARRLPHYFVVMSMCPVPLQLPFEVLSGAAASCCVGNAPTRNCVVLSAGCVSAQQETLNNNVEGLYLMWWPSVDLITLGDDSVRNLVSEVSIPNRVRELCERCFFDCKSLTRVIFVPQSSLEHIGVEAFLGTNISEMAIPDSVRVLDDRCFSCCKCLFRVTFGEQSSLEHIGSNAFYGTRIGEFSFPQHISGTGGGCFFECKALSRVHLCESLRLQAIEVSLFGRTNLLEISIPASVRELCDRCFSECQNLELVMFHVVFAGAHWKRGILWNRHHKDSHSQRCT